MTEHKLSKTPIMILVAMLCCMLWGSAFSCIKTGYRLFEIAGEDTISQILFAGIRFTIAGMMVIVVSCITNKEFTKPKTPKRIATLSAYQTIIQYFFFYIGLAHTSGVKSSIITGAGTFLTLFVCSLLFRQESLLE